MIKKKCYLWKVKLLNMIIMNNLKEEIANLRNCKDLKEIELQLQLINKFIVTNYMFELSNGLRIYPIEVEAYFKSSDFNDEFVHGNELQKNNYGRFYVHRTGITKDAKYKGGTRGGIDICLSDSDDFYYGVLIRSAMFNDDTVKFGPNNVYTFIKECDNMDNSVLEKELVLKEAIEDRRDQENKSIILHSTRVGLGNKQNDEYKNMNLRTIVGLLTSSYEYKEKENVFRSYMIDKNLSEEDAKKKSIEILGYCPKSIIESI